MGLKSISGEFRTTILNLNLQSPPDVVTGLVNLTNSVTVSAYLDSIGQDALINYYNVKNPGDINTDGIPARTLNLNKTLNTPNDIVTGVNDLSASAAYASSFLDGRGEVTNINDFSNVNPGDVLTEAIDPRTLDLNKNLNTPADITAGVQDLTPNGAFSVQYLSGRGSFTIINDFNVKNPGDVLTDAIDPRNLDLAKNLNTPADITSGVQDLTPNQTFAAQYLSGRGSFSVINDFNVINPGDVLTDAVAPRNLDFSRNLNTPADIEDGLNDLSPNAAIAAQYLAGRGSFSVINDYVVANPGTVLSDAIQPRIFNFSQTLVTPTDITSGVQNLTPNSIIASQYLSGKGSFTQIGTSPNLNPGDVLSDALTPRQLNFNRTLNTPADIDAGLNNLSGGYAAQYLSGRGSFSVINDYTNVNPGNVQSDAVAPRQLNFNRTLNTPVDITAGLNNLSGSFAAQYLSGRGTDTTINDFPNLNPGTVLLQALTPRQLNLNMNLNTPVDITAGLTNLSGSIAAQYLAGRGTDTVINNFNVLNPGDVLSDALTPRALNLSMTLNTPGDITTGLGDLTANAALTAQYLSGRGTMTTINTMQNSNPGDVVTIANPLRISLFNKNLIKDPNDVTDQFTLANPGIIPIGGDTVINDFTVLNQAQLSPFELAWINSNALNRYQAEATELIDNTRELSLNNSPNTPQNPYLTADKLNNSDPTNLQFSDFINLPTASTPLSALLGTDLDLANLLTEPGVKNDTVLAQIGALQLKFHLEANVAAKVAAEALGYTALDDIVTNPLKIIEAIKNPGKAIFDINGNNDITTLPGGLGKVASFLSDVAGVNGLTTYAQSYLGDDGVVLRPTCFEDYESDRKLDERDLERIDRTGRGQRFSLFTNLGINKYTPEFVNKLDGTNLKMIGSLAKSQGSTDVFKTYISGGLNPLFYLLQDRNGLQVKGNSELTKAITFDPTNPGAPFSEPGVETVSKYGSVKTSFVWRGPTKETFLDPINKETTTDIWDGRLTDKTRSNDTSAFKFRDCSILATTQKLLESGLENVAIRSIDQTKTKFSDGYSFAPKSSGVITPFRKEIFGDDGKIIGFKYLVPGLDKSGNRDDTRMYNEVELCRAWTKSKPFTKITDLIRWKELNRKERNSVLDRYGNLNIHPSALNVNEGYGRLGDGVGDAVVEAFGERRARKYMFSIENLAWRESTLFTDLPACEKGANGGRIMWFPPYNIRFTDDTTTNWTTHQFLGRPEPIYTYNNTERSGTLSWDIVVDHPTVLNLLVQKEFAALTDGEVDELLAAFWAGCLEYDTFELARIWGVFSDSDIEYFKKVISDLDVRLPNDTLRKKIFDGDAAKDSTVKIDSTTETQPFIPNFRLFFENDIPLPSTSYTKTGTSFVVEPYDVYFETYRKLSEGIELSQNSEYKEEAIRLNYTSNSKSWIRYDRTIGKKMSEPSDYFFNKKTGQTKIYGYEKQYLDTLKSDYSAENYGKVKKYDLTINMVAHASPSAPGYSLDAINKYNDKLAARRFVSVVKWLVRDVFTSESLGVVCYNEAGVEINKTNINDLFVKNLEDTKDIVLFRGIKGESLKQKITLNVEAANGLTTYDVFSKTPGTEYKDLFGGPKTTKVDGVEYDYYEIPYNNDGTTEMYYMVKTHNERDKVLGKFKPNGTLIDNDYIGTCVSIRTSNGSATQINRKKADVVCGNLSSIASYARRVEINTGVIPKEIPIIKTFPPEEKPPLYDDNPLSSTNVTKREIAQRILNKLLTECDYFEFLSEEAPIVYNSLKQKLKYFTPAFHSMTPEGLNARLTFLQQCMRPGDTILKNNGEANCDAKNTAFGRPPVCVLRIGDFYHTKIIINNLNISYDPLVWDLNPEGIGVQPMLAKVQLSFKYIGGQGLRRYVDELQNALSFNYYANADVYDERTFANTDRRERDLINLEQDFFAQNSLDLIPIVNRAELITPLEPTLDLPAGTVGVMSKRLVPKLAGGTYYNSLVAATVYENRFYPAEACVIYQGQYYVRKDTNSGQIFLPTDTNNWTAVDHSNFGEFAFRQEYGRTYIQRYEINYKNIFGEMYKTFGEYVHALVYGEEKVQSTVYDDYQVLKSILKSKNYNKPISTTGDTIQSMIDAITGNTIPVGAVSGMTYFEIFNKVAVDKKYIEVNDVFKKHPLFLDRNNNKPEQFEALKLNLHPQEYMFKVGNGLGIPYAFNALTGATNNGRSDKFFPGSFTDGFTSYFEGVSETGGIFFKDSATSLRTYNEIMENFSKEFKTKLRLNLLPIWDNKYDKDLKVFKNYYSKLDNGHRIIIRSYLTSLFDSYYNELKSADEEMSNVINDKIAKLSVILAGLSLPLYGYDARKVDESRVQLYEVIPNAKKLGVKGTDLFGYEPYTHYKKLGYAGGDVLAFSDIKTIYDDVENGWDGQTSPSFSDYVGMGNGLYFFKQLTNMSYTGTTTGETTSVMKEYERNMTAIATKAFNFPALENMPNLYNFENLLPKAKAFSNLSAVINFGTGDYYFNTAYSFNPLEFGNTATERTLETTADNLVTRTASGDIVSTLNNSYIDNDYGMKYTWEKINYEILDFSNKTLDLMLSDSLEIKTNDVDLLYTPNLEFDVQLDSLTGVTIGVTTGTTTGTTTGATTGATTGTSESFVVTKQSLFYYGDNKKPNDNINPINYYLFNDQNPNITGTDLQQTLTKLNEVLPYEFTINNDYVNALPNGIKNQLKPVSGTTFNEKIKLTAIQEMVFMDFFVRLDQDKETHINLLKQYCYEAFSVPANIKDKPKQVEDYLNKRKKDVDLVLGQIFMLFSAFISELNSPITSLNKDISETKTNTVKNINKNLFSSTSEFLPSSDEIMNKMIKGSDEQYTLIMRETSKLDSTIVRNLKLFTKYKKDPIINLKSVEEPKVVVKNETTQLAEEYPELYQ